jgi:hypothetical protein
MAALFAASLAASVFLTRSDPVSAYYVTQTRGWELALGGLAALARPRWQAATDRSAGGTASSNWVNGVSRAVAAWVGLALIATAAATFSGGTAFPGLAALVPTAGTAMVLLARADGLRGSPDRLWRPRAVQFTGDVSYALYLWHWPVVVIAPFVLGASPGWIGRIGLLAGVFGLAWASRRFVEEPIRRSRRLIGSLRRTFAVGLASVAVVVLAAGGTWAADGARVRTETQAAQAALDAGQACLGAAATRDPACAWHGDRLITPPEYARTDKPAVYADDCWNSPPYLTRRTCVYGVDDDAAPQIALVGNSHAGHWQPALADLADANGWRLTVFLASECYPALGVLIAFETEAISENCAETASWMVEAVADGDFDLVVTSNRMGRGVTNLDWAAAGDAVRDGYRRTLDRWAQAGLPTLVLRDTPIHPSPVPDCVAGHSAEDLGACATDQGEALERDPLVEAAELARADSVADAANGAEPTASADATATPTPPRAVTVLDLTDRLCRDGLCHGVVGGVIAYFDYGHLSTAFSRTLAPDLRDAIVRLIGTASVGWAAAGDARG